ncbi:MAG: (2Fe-2S)-binding protein [Acutalibacteraceae bacterium]
MHGLWKAEIAKAEPSETAENGNYIVCKCNNVSYFDILDEIHKHGSIDDLMNAFVDVKDATKCTTGCGGCYDKVIKIISDEING